MQVDYPRRGDGGPAHLLVIVLFQKLFRIQCGHATGSSRGNGLPVAVILNVAGNNTSGVPQAVAMGHPAVSTVLVGARSPAEVARDLEFAATAIDAGFLREIAQTE